MITTIATSVIAALCLAGIFAAIKSRWLYLVAPRLYLNTPLSNGQIVSLQIKNAGLLPEEDVAVTLVPNCQFELIATSKSTLAVSGKTLSLPKLARAESVTVLLLVEGKAFEPSDIDSVESKATKGKIVDSPEKASALWQAFIIVPIMIFVFAVPFSLGTFVGSEAGVSAYGYINSKLELFGHSKQLAGYKQELRERYPSSSGKLAGAVKDRRVAIEVREIVRRGDVLTVLLRLSNNTTEILVAEASLKSASGGRGPLGYDDSRTEEFGLAPKGTKDLKLKVYVPEDSQVKLIEGSYSFKIPGGDVLHVVQMVVF